MKRKLISGFALSMRRGYRVALAMTVLVTVLALGTLTHISVAHAGTVWADVPVIDGQDLVRTSLTRQQLMNMAAASEARFAPHLALLKSSSSATARAEGERLEANIQAAKRLSASLPQRGIVLTHRVVLIHPARAGGTQTSGKAAGTLADSAADPQPGFDPMTWSLGSDGSLHPTDAITNYFAAAPGYDSRLGGAAAIRSDVESGNSTQLWQDTGGSDQWVYICNDVNTGDCYWHMEDYQIQYVASCVPGQPCPFPGPNPDPVAPRYHARLFDAHLNDGSEFTLADAHHDNQGHNCTDGWTGPRDLLGGGVPEGDIWGSSYSDTGNAGQIQCAYWDGQELNIRLHGEG